MRKIIALVSCLCLAIGVLAATVEQTDGYVVIRPDGGGARVVRLQVVGDAIIRVQATSENQLPQKPQSLMVVEQTARPKYTVNVEDGEVRVSTSRVQAVVSKQTGQVRFLDAEGNSIATEARDGKSFAPFRVPDREIGVDIGRVTENQRNALSWRMVFDLQEDEALYGLGQHQSEELNMRGKNEDLFQYNTKVSVPFVISSRGYGILWDSYSYCRFGQPEDYLQLNRAFRLYDKHGREGHLTGTYTASPSPSQGGDVEVIVRDEDSIYYEYDVPANSELCRKYDRGGIQNLPKGFKLKGSTVVYEGFIEQAPLSCVPSVASDQRSSAPTEGGTIDKAASKTKEAPSGAVGGASGASSYDFILYYAGYIKVYIGGELVVPERWRTAWNPNTYKFTAHIPDKGKTQLRIEWQPDGDVSYCGLRVAKPQTAEQREQLSVWSEMARDMDYYFIAGASMDEVISGYRTLTGRAPVYPKWAMGFWQSRERYKTQQEIVETLGEFRRRQIPIDNIVQDWNYWPEDQWGSHQFEAARYPNPQQMLDSVHKMGGRFMISVWPKFYCNTANYKELDAKGWMYHQAVVDDIHDWVGPGYVGSFYDAYSDGARKMFWRQMDENLYRYGIDAWWMDASEPNVRDCTPMWYRKALSGPTALGTSTEYFNAYALVNAQAIYEGQRGLSTPLSNRRGVGGEARVFLLTRSGFAGLQRYSTATWSGDIGTRWEDMRAQMTAGMNYSLSGLPFWGMDQGGFCVEDRYMAAQGTYEKTGVENDDLREWRELQARWSQFGAFIPLFRVHGQWPLREIWNLAPEEHPCYRSFVYYDQLRYRLMPYLYSMTGWVHLNDYTMMRALVMDFGSDTQTHNIKDQWMFGPSLMACPVSEYKARSRAVYFPKGRGWYDLYTGEQIVNNKYVNRKLMVDAPYERIPAFVPEGSIIPFGPAMQWSDEQPAELINLYVYAGRDARFTLYEDEGTNYNYEKGRYATIDITYDDASRTLTFGKRSGQFDGMLRQRRFNVVYVTKDLPRPLNLENPEGTIVSYSGKAISVRL